MRTSGLRRFNFKSSALHPLLQGLRRYTHEIENPPEPIQPHEKWTQAETIARYKEVRARTLRIINDADAPFKNHTSEHPAAMFGTLNAYQWLIYIPLHNIRHNQQIAEVENSPGFPKP